ncbi:hypothetical protein J2X15_002350 [Rhodoferax saidenbachensis]|uniref:LysR substrate-binding domain-containing protein n=1 Tax=Rhodoferax saidenbachensis TaxID=1484693 RepID=A0ABU1ZNE8_9BURK|nr:hypothetical protein [Rhodoferax saidenbachensis]
MALSLMGQRVFALFIGRGAQYGSQSQPLPLQLCREGLGGEGFAIQITLRLFASQKLQQLRFLFGLNAFSDHFQVEPMGQVNNAVHQPHVVDLCRHLHCEWHIDLGPISLYFASQKLLPAKTRAFIDFAIHAFGEQKLAHVLSAKSLVKSKGA